MLRLLIRNLVWNMLYVVTVFTSSFHLRLSLLCFDLSVSSCLVCPLTHPCLTFLQFSETQELIE